MNRYLQILQRANAKCLDECIGLLIANGLNTPEHVNIIIETIGVYLRDMIVPRLKVTSIRTYVSKLCDAINFPDEVIIDCLQHLEGDRRITFSEDRDYVVWIGPDPIQGKWANAHLSSLNKIVMDAILDENDKGNNG